MIKAFIFLEWKSFIRSSSFKMNLILKIILGIAAIFYSLMLLSLGVGVFYILKEKDLDPLKTINQFLIYWWLSDLVIRYFMQKSPVMRIKPLLTLPIKKKTIIHYLLGKSGVSFFNIYPAFFFVPFSVVLIYNGYSVFGVIAWHLAIMALTFANNYINLLVNNKNSVFFTIAAILLALGALQYFQLLDITLYTAPVFQAFYSFPIFGILIIAMPVLIYYANFKYFENKINLDDAVKKEEVEVETENLTWLDRYGILGTFLKNDIKLIKRNKRSKSTVMLSLFFLFYGLFFMSETYDGPVYKLFAGLFISGGFLFTFGGFVPSWDSAYYPLMMSQNIQYKEYLSSKWWLIVIATFISMVLGSFYIYFGWEFYLGILVGGIYNIGINSYIVLLSGAYVKTPIDLTSGKKAFGDKQSFNIKTILLLIPKMILPLLIFYLFYKVFDATVGYLVVAALGILGLAFRNIAFKVIEKVYKEEKYLTLASYKQQN